NAIVVADVTALGGWSGIALDTYEPRTYINPTYFATLGHGFPTAMGAKIAFPERAVVDISGDGAFLFNSQELETACRYGISIVALVIDDCGFGTIKELQKEQYGRCKGHTFNNPDWLELAEAYGAQGFVAEELEDVPAVIEKALSLPGPSIVVAKHDTLPSYALNALPRH
ncbi:MAG: thiamine pyrophosphate-dependent enzyme, partial [Chloroflexota bacterium]